MPYIQDLELTQCKNCARLRAADELGPLNGALIEYLKPGDMVPAGQCPDCEAIAWAYTLQPNATGYTPGQLLQKAFAPREGGQANDCRTCNAGVKGHAVISQGHERWKFACLSRLGVDG